MSKVVKANYTAEAVAGFTHRTAMEEAARCLLCHDAPCSKGCPAGTDPAKFIRSIRFRNDRGAAETIRENNILGGTCARVCPYDRLCEEACSRCGIDKPIEIGKLQRYAIEQEEAYGMKTLSAPEKKVGNVACVISRKIFHHEPPMFQGYEFIGIKGSTGKMSGSSGLNLTPETLLKIYEPESSGR